MEIILKAVSKKIGYTQVLDNINCLFLDGKIYGIVGYNGSGKTMLLRTIAGLVIPTSGTIDFDGKRLHRDISPSEKNHETPVHRAASCWHEIVLLRSIRAFSHS